MFIITVLLVQNLGGNPVACVSAGCLVALAMAVAIGSGNRHSSNKLGWRVTINDPAAAREFLAELDTLCEKYGASSEDD